MAQAMGTRQKSNAVELAGKPAAMPKGRQAGRQDTQGKKPVLKCYQVSTWGCNAASSMLPGQLLGLQCYPGITRVFNAARLAPGAVSRLVLRAWMVS